uniref:Uncharacterized protein LOC114346070 n=1 Tax=Diabrotica virgifera virgifera TaxID=50390 RepID=A0A6P7H9T8_DIAVI
MVVNLQFVFLFLMCWHFCGAQPSNSNPPVCPTEDKTEILDFPKCCLPRKQTWYVSMTSRQCGNISEKDIHNFYHYFYESNITHINSNRIVFDPRFYPQLLLNCSP